MAAHDGKCVLLYNYNIYIFFRCVFTLLIVNYQFQVLSIDCLIAGQPSKSDPSVFYIKALMHAFIPPLCTIGSFLFMAAIAAYLIKVKGDERHWWEIVRDKWITATIVTVFFMHPAVRSSVNTRYELILCQKSK
jgi:hypothetical protein